MTLLEQMLAIRGEGLDYITYKFKMPDIVRLCTERDEEMRVLREECQTLRAAMHIKDEALQYVVDGDGMIPRANSDCRTQAAAALKVVTCHHAWEKPAGRRSVGMMVCTKCSALKALPGGWIGPLENGTEQPAVASDDYCMMPRALTAENGAKALLTGEFKQTHELTCTACNFDIPQDDCEVCSGNITYLQDFPIEWTTIKDIYKKAVEHFAK